MFGAAFRRAALAALAVPTLAVASTGAGTAADLTVVALGTSLTARGGWPEALQERLASCLGRSVSVVTVAQPGATSGWGAAAVDRVLAARPDVVLVEMAANDAALHRFVSRSASERNMVRIFEKLAAQNPPPRIFDMAMNPVSGLRGWDRFFLDSYIDLHRELSQRFGGRFIDHRPAWQRMSATELRAAIPDGLHPTPAASAAVMVPTLAEAIAGKPC